MQHTDEQRRLHLDLRSRQAQLESIAKGNRKTYNLGKTVGLGGGVGAAWMLTIANPAIAGIVGAIALVNYILAAMKETEKTGEYRPLLGRKNLASLAMGLDRQSAAPPPTVTVEDDALYLEDHDLGEWLLLRTAMEPCIQFLSQYPDEHRDEVMNLAAIEAYRQYGYMYRSEPDTRHQMKAESVGQYALSTVRAQSDFLLDSPVEASSAVESAIQESSSPIGQNTRLNAIEVPAATIPSKPQQFAVTTTWDTVLGDPMRSRAIFGGQRTGKSYFAAAATKEIKQKQNTRIFHINLHSFGNEDSYYWQHAEQSIAVDMSVMDFQQAKVVVQSALRLVEAFYKTPNAILVFDEITIVGATNSRYRALVEPLMMFIADKITILCSSGKKRQQAIWALAPEMVAANLTQATKAIKTLSLLYISIAPGKTVKWEGQTIGASLELWNQLNVNYPIAPMPLAGEFECDRIACIDTEWIPLGDVPKLEPDSHKLERLVNVDAEDVPDEEELTSGKVEKPDMNDKDIYKMAIELEEWINAHSEVDRSKWYGNFNANRKGLTRPHFRYLLTLIEE
jgi:hypothetical protein